MIKVKVKLWYSKKPTNNNTTSYVHTYVHEEYMYNRTQSRFGLGSFIIIGLTLLNLRFISRWLVDLHSQSLKYVCLAYVWDSTYNWWLCGYTTAVLIGKSVQQILHYINDSEIDSILAQKEIHNAKLRRMKLLNYLDVHK